MSDDLNKKLKQITDILGQDNMPDNVKGLLSLLTNPNNKEESVSPKVTEPPSPREEKSERSELDENMEMIRKVRKVMDKLNINNDPRVNLLTAIKPFLNSKRQKKLGNCIKMLQMSSLTKLVDDQDKGIF
ncbi:MAG: hypothetical protein N3I35_02970 [Clostridia bacterium]|nr:hypothetical protein [Clostridia bacterium]